MERGTFQKTEVKELFEGYTRFEVFTDRPWEREHYAHLQQKIAGTTALPAYIVLDSEHTLEVARSYYTNHDDEFIEFLRRGLKNRPGFYSLLRFSNLLTIERDGSLESTAVQPVEYRGETHFAYDDTFGAQQRFRIPSDLEPGEYVIRVELVTALYRGDDRSELISIPLALVFEVKP